MPNNVHCSYTQSPPWSSVFVDFNKLQWHWHTHLSRPSFLLRVKLHSAFTLLPLLCRHIERDGVSNHQAYECLFNRLFRCRSMKTSNLRVTGLLDGNSPVTGGFPSQRSSNAENVPIWWRHHGTTRAFIRTSRRAPCVIGCVHGHI